MKFRNVTKSELVLPFPPNRITPGASVEIPDSFLYSPAIAGAVQRGYLILDPDPFAPLDIIKDPKTSEEEDTGSRCATVRHLP